jgi:hypothetical protein
MSVTSWAGIELNGVLADGDLTQLYPPSANAGGNPATTGPGGFIRQPCEGELLGFQVCTDGTEGGVIEVWDIAGDRAGADVSQSDVITDAQLDAAILSGRAKLLYKQNILGTGDTPPFPPYFRFMQGLAARWISDGDCSLNLNVNGGYRYIHGSV